MPLTEEAKKEIKAVLEKHRVQTVFYTEKGNAYGVYHLHYLNDDGDMVEAIIRGEQ